MAYIRTIKAAFFSSADIVCLSPLARLLYIALWTEADREGRLTWRPDTFKHRFFPGDACDIRELCAELVGSQLVIPYAVDDRIYAEIPTFKIHQNINGKERKSVLPERRVLNAIDTRSNANATGANARIGFPQERKGTGEEVSPPSQVGDSFSSVCVHSSSAAQNSICGGDDDF